MVKETEGEGKTSGKSKTPLQELDELANDLKKTTADYTDTLIRFW